MTWLALRLNNAGPHPRAVLHAVDDFLPRKISGKESAADLSSMQRAAFHIDVPQIQAAEIRVAQVGVAQDQLGDINSPQIDAAQVGVRKIDLLAPGRVLLKMFEVIRTQITIGRVVDNSGRWHSLSPTGSIARKLLGHPS